MKEYLKQKHAETYMGTDDSIPEAFDSWLNRLDTDELIAYTDEFNQSLVRRVREEIVNLTEPYEGSKWLNTVDPKQILCLPSLSPTPDGDNQ